jgi:hypothetical protein
VGLSVSEEFILLRSAVPEIRPCLMPLEQQMKSSSPHTIAVRFSSHQGHRGNPIQDIEQAFALQYPAEVHLISLISVDSKGPRFVLTR